MIDAADFFKYHCSEIPGHRTQAKYLYVCYKSWCKKHNHRIVTEGVFQKQAECWLPIEDIVYVRYRIFPEETMILGKYQGTVLVNKNELISQKYNHLTVKRKIYVGIKVKKERR